jgi:hypothetical protein
MGAISTILVIFLGALVFFFTASLFLAIIFNVKVLSALGIEVSEYLYTTNVATINKQMNNCSACTNLDECDDNLTNNNIAIDEIDFCNNESSLKEMLSNKPAVKG